MNCEQVKEQIADYLSGSLNQTASEDLHEHFAHCTACKQEAEALTETWRMMGLLEQEEPSTALRSRFYQSLEAYRQGATAAASSPTPRRSWFGWSDWVPRLAWSAAVLIAGVALGHYLTQRGSNPGDLARLQDEVHNMRQMVTLALLEQQSASDRLRGVDYAYHVEQSDTQVLSALLHAVNHDPNVNVRLAAVDALRKFAASPAVRNTLAQSLAKQDSPMVQIALIDLIVEMRDRGATPALRTLEANPVANKDVKARAVWGLSQLE